MDDAFFIDKDGNEIYSDTISSHIGLAKFILKNNQQLQEEYEKSSAHDPIDFLVQNEGYLKVSNIGYYKKITYDSSNLSDRQKEVLDYYHFEEGFELDDLKMIKLQDKGARLD